MDQCVSAAQKGDAIFPLNWVHVYETQKIQNEKRRLQLAHLMSILSLGTFIRPRQDILVAQLQDFYAQELEIKTTERPSNWFVAKSLVEAFPEEFNKASPIINAIVTTCPAQALQDWVAAGISDIHLRQLASSTKAQIRRMEDRRALWRSVPAAQQRRAHAAMIFWEAQDTAIQTLWSMGVDPIILKQENGRLVRQMMNKVPLLRVEREMAYRIELEKRSINENDLRDFSSFCTAFALGFEIVGEKASVGRLLQTGLPRELKTRVCSDLGELFSS